MLPNERISNVDQDTIVVSFTGGTMSLRPSRRAGIGVVIEGVPTASDLRDGTSSRIEIEYRPTIDGKWTSEDGRGSVMLSVNGETVPWIDWPARPAIDPMEIQGALDRRVEEFGRLRLSAISMATPEDPEEALDCLERLEAVADRLVRDHGGSDRRKPEKPQFFPLPSPHVVDSEVGPVLIVQLDHGQIDVVFPESGNIGRHAGRIPFGYANSLGWQPMPKDEWRIDDILDRFDRSPDKAVKEVIAPLVREFAWNFPEGHSPHEISKRNAQAFRLSALNRLMDAYEGIKSEVDRLREDIELGRKIAP